MKYRDGYDGQVVEDYSFQLPKELWPEKDVTSIPFITLTTEGVLTTHHGYCWDYASVPTKFFHWLSNKIAGKKSKVPSLGHDALCQLHRNGYLPMDEDRFHTDIYFRTLLLERKFWKVRAWAWFKAVRLGAKYNKQEPKEVFEAP
jgi:hypothetical protein